MIGPTCPDCGWIHPTPVALGRFDGIGARGFTFVGSLKVYSTREEAVADWCAAKRRVAR